MPASCTLSSDIVSLPSFSLPIWSSSSSAAASKRGGAPRASPIWSATSTLPRLAFAASTSLPLTEGSGALPDDVALGGPDKGLRLRNEAGLVIDETHARHGVDGGKRRAAAIDGKRLGSNADVAAGDG